MLAQVLEIIESLGAWPKMVAQGFTSLIPKGEGAGALKLRPLSVLSQIYRVWEGMRLEEATLWQEGWAHPAAYAFRPRRSCLDAASLLQLLIELNDKLKTNFGGAGMDYTK